MENLISPFFFQSLVFLFPLASFSFLHRIVLHSIPLQCDVVLCAICCVLCYVCFVCVLLCVLQCVILCCIEWCYSNLPNHGLLLARFDHVISFTEPTVSDYRTANINGGKSFAGGIVFIFFHLPPLFTLF